MLFSRCGTKKIGSHRVLIWGFLFTPHNMSANHSATWVFSTQFQVRWINHRWPDQCETFNYCCDKWRRHLAGFAEQIISMIAVGECAMIHNDKSWIIKPPELLDAPRPCFLFVDGSPAGANKEGTKGIWIWATHKAEAEGNSGWCWSCQWNKKRRICTFHKSHNLLE